MWGAATVKIRAWLWAVVAVGLLFTVAEAGKLDRCIARCERNHPTPEPSASPSPTPTRVPLPCEPFSSSVVKDFDEGQERMLCFDVRGPGSLIVTVGSQNRGNAQCAQMQATLISPSGQTYDSMGAQPAGTLFREEGRWYWWLKLIWGNPGSCRSYVFTVVK